jgi:predicted NUDIX family phosphoesterase
VASSLLDAVETALAACGKPLTALSIVNELRDRGYDAPGGATPWKTIGARLAVDIRANSDSRFVRVGRGLYALRAWSDVIPVEVPPRRINPLDEDILVLERSAFEALKAASNNAPLSDIHYNDLLNASKAIHRMKAEEDSMLVQIIPSFVIFESNNVLSFKRTRKTPEQRLHDTYSIVFGGHLQAEDLPALFADDFEQVERFLFRELYEELAFDPPLRRSVYVGVLHLDATPFERQHAGVVFAVELESGTTVTSLEPGYQSTLRFLPWETITASPVMEDRWSVACINYLLEAE